MEPMDTALRLEALLEHADWVRRLARSLVADPARAEDVAQETWLAALRSPPAETGHLRAWLGAVVRNAARRSGRSEERRGRREASAARDEALPSAAELVEQADLQREIAALVIAQGEPYRGTLLLRYYQGLGPAEIAARTGVPLNTVRTRLARGLEQLRERLDRRFESRDAWSAVLAPLAAPALSGAVQGSTVLSLGTLIMATKLKWAAAVGVTCLGLWWLWPREEASVAESPVSARGADTGALVEAPPSASEAGADARVSLARAAGQAPAAGTPARVTTLVRGRCVDLAGAPIPGLELEWVDGSRARVAGGELLVGTLRLPVTPELVALAREPGALARAHPELTGARGVAEELRGEATPPARVFTALDGTFELEIPSSAPLLGTDTPEPDPRVAAEIEAVRIHAGEVRPTRSDLVLLTHVNVREFPEPLYVVAPCVDVSGRVVDPSARPILGAHAKYDFRLEAVPSFPYAVTGASNRHGLAITDESGSFLLKSVPTGAGAIVRFSAEGFVGDVREVPAVSEHGLVITLEAAPAEVVWRISGRAVHADGRPAAGAQVDFGQDGTIAGADGSFSLHLSTDPRTDVALTAFVEGARPCLQSRVGELLQARGPSLDGVVLVLEPALAPIRGRVVRADGSPCAAWRVARRGGEAWGTSNRSLESMAAGEPMAIETDREGRFVLGGLLEREYAVRVWDPETLVSVDGGPARPGAELELVVSADALAARVLGRVISRRGMPVAGAAIVLSLPTEATDAPSSVSAATSSMVSVAVGRSGADGSFELRDVPRRVTLLGATDPRIRARSVELEPLDLTREVLLEVDFELRLRVEPRVAGEFDAFRLLDRGGKPLAVEGDLHHVIFLDTEIRARAGVFPLCTTTEEAEAISLLSGGEELRRVPLALRPGEINVLSL